MKDSTEKESGDSLQDKLSKCDADGTGQISLSELRALLEGSSYSVTDKEAELILKSLDASGDSKLSYEQFIMGEIHMRAQQVI